MNDHARIAAEKMESAFAKHGVVTTLMYDEGVPIIAQAIADATAELRADNQRLESSVRECIQGTKELGESLADAVKRLAWYALLARAANSVIAEAGWSEREGYIVIGGPQRMPCEFSSGLPIETPELRAALEAAMKE